MCPTPRSFALLTLLIACAFSGGCYRTAQWWLDLPPFRAESGEEFEAMAAMRDGVKLATDVYLPGAGTGNREPRTENSEQRTGQEKKWPTLLVRTPYSKSGVPMFMEVVGRFFARYGYAVVIQDVRGRYRSEGEWYPVLHELEDGADTARWVLAQPWCNGSLGLLGASYLTVTAWLVADQVPEAVKTMVLAVGSLDPYIVAYQRGMMRSDVVGSWILAMHTPELTVFDVRRHFDAFTRHWPASEADDATVGAVPFHDDFLNHPARDEFWLRHPVGAASRARMPVLMLTGWFDFFLPSQIQDYQELGNREESRMLIGPWSHLGGFFEDPALAYGSESYAYHALPLVLEWLDVHFQGAPREKEWGPVRTFAIGENRWVDTRTWPPPGSEARRLYLDGSGHTEACRGGRLTAESPPADSPSDHYMYDPRHPAPTIGGGLLAWIMGVRGLQPNAQDQGRICGRLDVLSYLTEPIKHPLRLAGPIRTRLWVSSTAEDTAFTAKLIDVPPHGPAVNIQSGIATLAFRESDTPSPPVVPGAAVAITIDLSHTHWVVQEGHRLRLDVSSSSFPEFRPHPNRAGPTADVADPIPATQTVYHDLDHPSCVELTVRP